MTITHYNIVYHIFQKKQGIEEKKRKIYKISTQKRAGCRKGRNVDGMHKGSKEANTNIVRV
jgi:hypothetical protein